MHAVLTGDIVNSTLLDKPREERLFSALNLILSGHRHEFFRGDSFQSYLSDPQDALKVALLCRTAAIALDPEASEVSTDVRISIGLGNVESPVRTLATAKGEAFLLSGRALDDLQKTEGRLIIVIENKIAAVAFEVMSDYINSIYKQMTPKQAEVILELLNGNSQQQAAENLKRSKSTISQHVTAGRWDEITKIMADYSRLVQLVSL
jgi:hypothetical protein